MDPYLGGLLYISGMWISTTAGAAVGFALGGPVGTYAGGAGAATLFHKVVEAIVKD